MKSFHKAEQVIQEIDKDEEMYVEGSPKSTYKNLICALAKADLRGIGMDEEQRAIDNLSAKVFEKVQYLDFSNDEIDVDERIDYAVLLTRQKEYGEAEQIFRSIISQNADNAGPAFNNFAIELRKNGERRKAFEIYTELLKYKIPDKKIVIQNMMRV
jgi:tetratricopeptide (TPR) repeat protein